MGVAQVARPDDGDVVFTVEPELAVDLLAQEFGVVPNPPGPVRTELGKVLADLSGVDACTGGQFF